MANKYYSIPAMNPDNIEDKVSVQYCVALFYFKYLSITNIYHAAFWPFRFEKKKAGKALLN